MQITEEDLISMNVKRGHRRLLLASIHPTSMKLTEYFNEF
jgi:hypothetical protein